MAQPVAAEPGLGAGDPIFEPRLSVRQGGGGNEKGLFNRLTGPAAILDFGDRRGTGFRSLAGAMEGPGGARHGYVGGTGRASVLGLDASFNYAAAEDGGNAIEARLSRDLGGVRLNLSRTWNHDFESGWTGFGESRAATITQAGVDWAPLAALPINVALRQTQHVDGSESQEIRTVQTLMLGSGMLVNSTATPLGLGADETFGNLLYYGSVAGVQLTAGFDYGAAYGMRPGVLRLGLEKWFEESWSVYGFGERDLASGAARLDIGAAREIGDFSVSAFVGGDDVGTAYAGLRLTMQLSKAPRDHRWFGF